MPATRPFDGYTPSKWRLPKPSSCQVHDFCAHTWIAAPSFRRICEGENILRINLVKERMCVDLTDAAQISSW